MPSSNYTFNRDTSKDIVSTISCTRNTEEDITKSTNYYLTVKEKEVNEYAVDQWGNVKTWEAPIATYNVYETKEYDYDKIGDAVVEAFLRGELESKGVTCDHHEEAEEGFSCLRQYRLRASCKRYCSF